MEKYTVVFDLCNTLVKANTTFEFIAFYLKKKRLHLKLFLYYFFKSKIFSIFVFIFLRKIRYRFQRDLLIGLIVKEDPDVLRSISAECFDRHFRTKIDPLLSRRLKRYRNLGYSVVIVSGSLDFVVEPFAKYFGVEFSGSEIYFDKHRRSLCFNIDLMANKGVVVRTIENIVAIYTDNFEDLPLRGFARNFYGVCRTPNDRKFWENNGADIKIYDNG